MLKSFLNLTKKSFQTLSPKKSLSSNLNEH